MAARYGVLISLRRQRRFCTPDVSNSSACQLRIRSKSSIAGHDCGVTLLPMAVLHEQGIAHLGTNSETPIARSVHSRYRCWVVCKTGGRLPRHYKVLVDNKSLTFIFPRLVFPISACISPAATTVDYGTSGGGGENIGSRYLPGDSQQHIIDSLVPRLNRLSTN
jgi:hypothetical protein